MTDTKRLIEAVKAHCTLYNQSLMDYRDHRKKDKIWDEISSELNLEGDVAKRRWKNLRDTYARHVRSLKTHTGQANKLKYWQWAKQMEFLKPFLAFASTKSNIQIIPPMEDFEREPELLEITYSSDTNVMSPCSSDICVTPTMINKKRKFDQDGNVNKVIDYLRSSNSNNNLDGMELLFMGYAKLTKTFSLRRQVSVKMKIATIMMEEELLQDEENNLSTNRTDVL